ncbi:LysR family transcriptional regulator [Ningiella sp. W23]|uniref:LysR family transcriptional regulator n=1 Tax=Ningiella sp. W23 TaxID=3023715 RepID=UPI0037583299
MFYAIEEFVAVGRAQSFSGAAKRLGVSTSHVSRRINGLEEKLGVRLVNRTTRVVKLTDAGFEYFHKCYEIIQEMEEANSSLTAESQELEGRIRVSAAGDYAERYVAPCLARFGMQHPKIRIELDFNPQNINLIDDGFDFAVRYGLLSDSSLVARKLTDRDLVAAATPSYFKQFGVPAHPSDLSQHRCVVSMSETWRFTEQGNNLNVRVPAVYQSNSASALVSTCLTGLGVVYLPYTTIKERLDSGELVQCLHDFSAKGIPTWLVYPSKRFVPKRVRAVLDYLIAELA